MQNYRPLFLKYRPQSLADLVGQPYVFTTLSNAIKHNRIFHAYLFTGPRGTGKTSTARILAKSLNCQNGPTVTPCQQCAACLEISRGTSASVFEIDAASNNSVDDARLLIERAPLVAQGGRYKIYIIDECHMLTKEAFNALLKTIEEPPANVIFVLATTEEQKVLPTIVSRCQRLIFSLVNQTDLGEHLRKIAGQEKIEIESEACDFIARRAFGGMRDALGLLDQASLLTQPGKTITISDLSLLAGALNEDSVLAISKDILNQDGQAALFRIKELVEEGREPYLIASELAKHFLNLVKASYLKQPLARSAQELIAGSPTYIAGLITEAQNLDRVVACQIVQELDKLEQVCKRFSQPSLNLEIGILSLCHRLDIVQLSQLNERLAKLEELFAGELELPKASAFSHQPIKKEPVFTPDTELDTEPEESAPEQTGLEKTRPEQTDLENTRFENSGLEQIRSKQTGPEQTSTVEKKTSKIAAQIQAPDINVEEPAQEQAQDQDLIWTQMLEQLKGRNIPTFSLVSTHAFPVALTKSEFTIGVSVEHFQKMIETKLDHIKAALQTVQEKPLSVRIKTCPPPPLKPIKSDNSTKSAVSELHTQKQDENPTESPTQSPIESSAELKPEASARSKVSLAHITQEAYQLFEGPGSRLITSNL